MRSPSVSPAGGTRAAGSSRAADNSSRLASNSLLYRCRFLALTIRHPATSYARILHLREHRVRNPQAIAAPAASFSSPSGFASSVAAAEVSPILQVWLAGGGL